MIKNVFTYLLRFGRSLRNKCIRWIAEWRGLSEVEIQEEYGRPCVVCRSQFTPRFKHHHLCSSCEKKYMKCWSDECGGFFKPRNGHRSETYCSECREEGKASDLAQNLMDEGYLEKSPGGDNLAQPVLRLTEGMVQRRNRREMERTEEALESFGIDMGE